MTLYTTLALLQQHGPCTDGWQKLLASLTPKQRADKDRRIPLTHIIKSNGLDDCLWALRACTDQAKTDKLARLFAVKCAKRVLPIFEKARPTDKRPRQAIEVAERYAMGRATNAELATARAAARAAAWDAARDAAWDAARDAARNAAWDAAWDAARNAAWDAARDAAGDAAGDAAWDAAWDAERAWQTKTLKAMLSPRKRK